MGCSATEPAPPSAEDIISMETYSADVITVSTQSDSQNSATFSVTIDSKETGCEHYADWWEVVDLDGNLRYRRILAHSHVDEQPFTRSGGPVPVTENEMVIVRAHLNTGGYGQVMIGSVQAGFQTTDDYDGFAPEVEEAAPQPSNCAF